MFDRFLNSEPTNNSLIASEEIALIPHRKEAVSFIALTQKQRLNILESLLLEKVANGEDAEEIMQAIAMLHPPSTELTSTNRNVHHSFYIPIASEMGDLLRSATLAALLAGVVMAVILAANPRFCGSNNSSQFCSQVNDAYRYFYYPKGK
jgi:hypothetical protein